MESAAVIRQTFDRSFTLSEEDLRKLEELVTTRLGASDDFHIEFLVRRQDGMLTKYPSATEVLAEEHAPRNPVEALNLICTCDTTKLDLGLDAKDDVVLSIQSSKRDVAYLLLADLRDYLKGEVIRRWGFQFRDNFLIKIVPSLLVLTGALAYLSAVQPIDADTAHAALRSPDVSVKLNYLIELTEHRAKEPDPRYFMGGLFLTLLLPWLMNPILKWFWPESVFHWGKVGIKHDERMRRRGRIWWGVVIAFAVGIASTVVTDFFKRDHQNALPPSQQVPREQ